MSAWLERTAETLAAVIASSAPVAPLAAFAGGVLTAMNPCVLAMIPLMVGFAAGVATEGTRERGFPRAGLRTFRFSLLFVVGFALELTLLFTLFAAGASWLHSSAWKYALAAICAVTGLHLVGLLRLPSLPIARRSPGTTGAMGAIVLGLLFGIVSIPCTGPVLLLLIGLVPEIGAARAGMLLFLYGLGHALLILIAGTSVGAATVLIRAKRMQTAALRLRQAAGALVMAGGAWILLR